MKMKISIPTSLLMPGSVGRQTIGSLGSSSEDSTNGSLKKPTFNERHPKVVRSLTVVAYIFCVSIAAILLSAYYLLIYKISPSGAQRNSVNTTNLPCRGTVSHLPDAGGEYIPTNRLHYSRYTHSSLRAAYRPHSGTPPPVISQPPSKLASNSNSDYSQQQDNHVSENSPHSLHLLQTTSSLVSHNSSSRKTSRIRNDQQPHDEMSVFPIGTKHATTPVPNSSPPTPYSILIQKLLTSR